MSMEGQWGWIGGPSLLAASTGWFHKPVQAEARQVLSDSYWGFVPQMSCWTNDGSVAWLAAAGPAGCLEVQEQTTTSSSSWALAKCGWLPDASATGIAFIHAPAPLSAAAVAASACASAHGETCVDSDDSDSEFSLLPDDLVEKILAGLPLLSLFRARAVCKRWNALTSSKSFRSQVSSHNHKPWYLMYKDSEKLSGVAFDPTSRKWHNFVLPPLDPSASFVASAGGLACFLDKSNAELAYVCNPMTKSWRKLPKNSSSLSSDYCAVAMSVDRGAYKVVVARSTPVTNDYAQWSLSIEVYDSSLGCWKTPAFKLLHGWRPGEESNICSGTFYCVTHSTVGAGHDYSRHGLIAYDIERGAFQDVILPMPCSLSCVRLVNCWGRLVMVGGIGTYDFIKGVGVWELDTEWKQVSRMPTKQFHGFAGGLDDVFSCSGHGDLIYIHSYGSPQLMVFDMPQGSWTWARACPVLKRDPLHLFTGFCFQPRLDMSL